MLSGWKTGRPCASAMFFMPLPVWRVLPDARGQLAQLELEQLALEAVGLDDDLASPADLAIEAGEAQTAFLALHGAVLLEDDRVDVDALEVGFFAVGGVVDDEHLVG